MRMSDERFVELESRLAHQDHVLNELNDVVTDQQARIMQLEALCRSIVERVRDMGDAGSSDRAIDERPPHY